MVTGLKTFQMSGDHPDDENHYLYLPVGTYSVRVYYPDYSNIRYEVVVTTEGVTVQEYGFVQTYQVTANLTGLTANVPESVEAGKPLSFTLAPEKGYGLPAAIQVTMGGQNLLAYQYAYDQETGLFLLEHVTGDVVVTAEGISGIQTFAVKAELRHMTYEGPDYVSVGKTATGTLIPDDGYQLPTAISVTMGGQATENFTYDPSTGSVAVPQVTGDLMISGDGVLIGGRTITYELAHLSHNGPTEYVSGQDLVLYLTPEEGYLLPETVSVTGDQAVIRFTYNPDTGCLSILNATGNLIIQAQARSTAAAEVAIAIDPTELTVDNKPGQKGQFTAIVTGTDDMTVTWSVDGNTSEETRVENGQLFLGGNETATIMTVTATSHADPTKSASATVYVVEAKYTITIGKMTHGAVTADPVEATKGTLVTLTVLPEEGYALKEGSLKVNGTAIEGATFTMPDEDVVITAEFVSEAEDLLAAAEAAKRAAEDAQKKAEEARIAAEEAQRAAEAAAGSAADDKEAAEAAKAAAEAAMDQAKLAEDAARAAQEAAEAAAKAAEESNQAAAKEAGKAAEEAQKAADKAANAAKSAREAAEASEAAQTAQDKAEEAQRTAEEAQKAAKEAAESAAEDKTAAEAARVKAEEAQREAEAARDAAEEAKDAANAARDAAEAHNLAAAEEARKAADEAAKAATSAAEAVESAKLAAQAMVKAQAAQTAAEEAARVAKEAQEKAEEAQRKAEEAAGSTAEDKEAAQKAAQEAKEAKEAAEAAQGAAEEAQKAAETARKAAEDANLEAAASAALAAEYAQKVTETYNEIVQIKAEMVEFLADAQKAAEKAEEERKAAEEAQKKAEEAALAAAKSQALIELALMDTTGCNAEQKEAAAAVLAAAREAIQAAETREEVAALLAEAQEAMEEAMNLVCASDLFRDVAENTWYHEGVDYMVRQGYMDGMGGGLFGVNGTMTRGQMVTILYRIAGKPSVEGLENPFRDVAEGRYYTDAVIWAAANGIVEGMEEGVFAPEGAVTRQQVAVILYRHSGAEAGNEDLLSSYPDGKQVAPYARQAMNWAVSQGLIRGVENGGVTTLSPAATATRAQMATIFLRYLEAG